MNPNNPLSQYFRQPSIYLRLPSLGKFYPPGTLEMTPTGEFPVYPMTAIDEITYRTPDALFNGQAVVDVIQSCVPAIKNAWAVPSIDVDSILVAIRIASYGHDMDFDTKCPACGEQSERRLDLRTALDALKAPDYTKSVNEGEIEIFFRPMTYKNMTDNNKSQYEEQRILQQLPTSDNPDQLATVNYTDIIKKITDISVRAIVSSIAFIRIPGSQVDDPNHILEFLKNCDSKLFVRIRDYIIEYKQRAELQPLKLTCDKCANEYEQAVTLDMSNFFGAAS
jgi:hypothetical protein